MFENIIYKTELQIAFESGNVDLIKYFYTHKSVDINSRDIFYIFLNRILIDGIFLFSLIITIFKMFATNIFVIQHYILHAN